MSFNAPTPEQLLRIAALLGLAIGAHLGLAALRRLGQKLVASRAAAASAKARTILSLLVSVAVFVMYFVVIGMVLKEFGVSLTAYFASATVIGLAVGFGSQGLVQDVVTGVTVIASNLFNVGDMVEISGQTGIVQNFGIRFTRLVNFMGADVYIPNRTIGNVVRYPRGYVRALLDVTLPQDVAAANIAEEKTGLAAQAVQEQFPGILVTPPSLVGRFQTSTGRQFLRVKFRVWPGQGAPLDTRLKPELIQLMKSLDPSYADWMVNLTYEVEEKTVAVPVQFRPKGHK